MEIIGLNNRDVVSDLVKDTKVPKMFRVKQSFPEEELVPEKIPAYVRNLMLQPAAAQKIKPGMRIAITAGSRGIANVDIITKAIVDGVKELGAEPFIVPAMGSHGGARAEGQTELLGTYNITEETMGCPILSSMEVVQIGINPEGKAVFIDKNAAEADGIIVSCRVKPHPAFRADYESGIMKMMAIGLGKQHGAEACHAEGIQEMGKNVYLFGKTILENAKILFSIACVENPHDKTADVFFVDSCDIEKREPELLKLAYANMPRIMVDSCDVLVVDQIGKNISGDGMDPNITGTALYKECGIKSQHVVVLDVTDVSHGNAMCVGMASATTDRLIKKADLSVMYPNAITAACFLGAYLPMIMKNDKEAMQVCLKACVQNDKDNPRVVRIHDTLSMAEIWLSEAYYEEAKNIEGLTILSEPEEMVFDEKGNLF